MLSLRSLALIAPLALVAAGNAQTVLLRYKPSVGTTKSYVTIMKMTTIIPGMPANMGGATTTTTPMTMRVISKSGNLTKVLSKTGKVTAVLPPNSPAAAMKAKIEEMGSNKTTTMDVDELANPKNVAQPGNPGMGQMGASTMQGAQGVAFPAKAVKVGDSWSGVLDMGKIMSAMGKGTNMGAAQGMKMTGRIPIVTRLTAIEKRGGKTFAKLSVSMIGAASMTMGAAGGQAFPIKMHVTSTIVVDTATGLLESSSTISDTDTSMMGTTMKQHVIITMK